MIVHVARPVNGGFEMVEIWESKAHADKLNEEVVGPAVGRIGVDTSGSEPVVVDFESLGLMVGKR